MKRGYLAVVHGVSERGKVILENYLLKNRKTNTVSVVDKGTEGAQKAVLDYEVLDSLMAIASLKLTSSRKASPDAGCRRFHRVSLISNERYGYRVNRKSHRFACWSHTITCKHPIFNAELSSISYPAKREIWSKFELEQAGQGCTIFHEDWTPEQRNVPCQRS